MAPIGWPFAFRPPDGLTGSLPSAQQGRVGYILLWLVGVPIPILFLIYMLRGCS